MYCTVVNNALVDDPFGNGNEDGTNPESNSTISDSSSSAGSSTSPSSSSSSSSSSTRSSPSSAPSNTPAPDDDDEPEENTFWRISEKHAGSSFFEGFDFFTGDDPTHGSVDYVDEQTARSGGLLRVNDAGNAILSVDTTDTVADLRRSVRIQGKSRYNGGLFILDAAHMPTGCGTWPAFWTNGPSWPRDGEIDIVEGVHDYTNNQYTIHAEQGCTLPSASPQSLDISGSLVGNTDCAALTTGNQGCGIRSDSRRSFGAPFNQAGGGVYAMEWTSQELKIWFFSRGDIPRDITNEKPDPSRWGQPAARWPGSTCNPSQFFVDHHIILNTSLCGDWSGNVWDVAGIPGQEQSCRERTGFATCQEFVRSRGSSFTEAYWEVRSIHVYQPR